MPIVIASHNEIWIALNQFVDDLSSTLASTHTAGDISQMTISDYKKFAKDWIVKFKA